MKTQRMGLGIEFFITFSEKGGRRSVGRVEVLREVG